MLVMYIILTLAFFLIFFQSFQIWKLKKDFSKCQKELLDVSKNSMIKVVSDFQAELKLLLGSDVLKTSLEKFESKFEEELQNKYDEAVEKIRFDTIEYKRTITKKRKEHNRKFGKDAKPERQWRFIDEE